jgi:DNA-binding Lrp family transcriptional regulator
MDDLDRQILDVIQSGFPLAHRPYDVVGERVGLTGAEVLARVRRLKARGVIRRIGASYASKKLGWFSTLCGARVPEEKLEHFVETVNANPGVTHNYLRENEFNVWFTLIAQSEEDRDATLAGIEEATGVRVFSFPAERMYKIKVDFKMGSQEAQ